MTLRITCDYHGIKEAVLMLKEVTRMRKFLWHTLSDDEKVRLSNPTLRKVFLYMVPAHLMQCLHSLDTQRKLDRKIAGTSKPY